ncbi:NUDIX domain-containing protein [Hirsutella rhossiliensis]|uniref:NAD(+) diphosphatase n=1 Tax=Hirsutella rhossiliensis TaxID=111463 RepID=A0A9P8MMY4_9HYPO|nr:NUDIX domain-containing protein [Hirsutella rhossiliensis]KAH0959173.1 NUDIX domain-containing protein [Hirsutella rhossiliensis]
MPEPPALHADASMLTRRFGKEIINYYAGSRLNRYSFLRSDAVFLAAAAASPAARFIVLSNLAPLVAAGNRHLAHLPFDRVRPLIGPDPFALSDARAVDYFDSSAPPKPLVVFLGTVEGGHEAVDLDTSDFGVVRAQPIFAVDATPRGAGAGAAAAFLKQHEAEGLSLQTDVRSMVLNSEADWNTRNPFCAGCGGPNLSVEAGYKRVCPRTDRKGGSDAQPRADCPTRHGVSNLCFPRSDPTMIAAVVSADGQRILLGRQARYPPDWYSTLAGFLEPGESVEEAVRREVWEEAGVRVGRVVIHSTQPWPYPSTLMLGAVAQALPGEEEITLNDKELESAKWFTVDEVREALKETGLRGEPAPEGHRESRLRVPPPQAIANRLMTAVVEGYLTGIPKI